jgi:hypothetical protein
VTKGSVFGMTNLVIVEMAVRPVLMLIRADMLEKLAAYTALEARWVPAAPDRADEAPDDC